MNTSGVLVTAKDRATAVRGSCSVQEQDCQEIISVSCRGAAQSAAVCGIQVPLALTPASRWHAGGGRRPGAQTHT